MGLVCLHLLPNHATYICGQQQCHRSSFSTSSSHYDTFFFHLATEITHRIHTKKLLKNLAEEKPAQDGNEEENSWPRWTRKKIASCRRAAK